MEQFMYRSGTIPGFSHTNKKKNNQDYFAVGEAGIAGEEYLFGVVSDGCTGMPGSRTEIGSILISQFIVSEILLILSSGARIEDLPGILYPRCIGYFRTIAGSTVMGGPEIMWNFVRKNLLCTIVGFAMNREELVVFNSGDGMMIFNDEITVIDQDDVPNYIAYHLVDKTILGKEVERLQTSFDVSLYDASKLSRFAICTDGIVEEEVKEPGVVNGIWNYEPGAKAGLQWWLNIQSVDNGRFRDDCTIIAVNKIPEEGR